MNPPAGGGVASQQGSGVQVIHDRSLTCEFAIPADLAARIRAENERRLAVYREHQLAQRSAEQEIPEGLERIDVYVDRAAAAGPGAAPLVLAHPAPAAVGESAPAAKPGEAPASASTEAASAGKAPADTATLAGITGSGDVEEDLDDGWAQTADPGDAPDAAMLAAINTFGARRDGEARGGGSDTTKAVVTDAAFSAASVDVAEEQEDQAQRGANGSTSTKPLGAEDDATTAVAASATAEGDPDPDEPVLVLDAGTIMDEGADLTPEQLRDFQDGIGASMARDCDAACESLFDNFTEVSGPLSCPGKATLA